jgi:hypothetical protein
MDIEGTELFDLFGESGYCSICQDDLKEGERVRTVAACQHLFHATCLDEWLRRKPECPMCRKSIPVRDRDALRAILQTQLQALLAAVPVANLPTEIVTAFQGLGLPLGPEPVAVEAPAAPAAVDPRQALTYALTGGILKRFPNAVSYTTNRTAVRDTLANFILDDTRPHIIDWTTRSGVSRAHAQASTHFHQTHGVNPRSLRAHHAIRAWHERLALQEPLRDIWAP